jgi:hypothetical protein
MCCFFRLEGPRSPKTLRVRRSCGGRLKLKKESVTWLCASLEGRMYPLHGDPAEDIVGVHASQNIELIVLLVSVDFDK